MIRGFKPTLPQRPRAVFENYQFSLRTLYSVYCPSTEAEVQEFSKDLNPKVHEEVAKFELKLGKLSFTLANIRDTRIVFVCPSKILHFIFLGIYNGPNNAYAKFWRHEQSVLWYF